MIKSSWCGTYITLLILIVTLVAPLSVGAEDVEMILGKPYTITPGDEPGTFVCKWGDETVVWKPKLGTKAIT